MIRSYQKLILRSLLSPSGPGKVFNILRHAIAYPKSHYPLTANIGITHRCNLTCWFCAYKHNEKSEEKPIEITDEKFEQILNLPALKHTLLVNLGTGEALTHKNIFKYIAKIQEKGKLASFVSNGMILGKRMDDLLACPPDFLWVSLYDDMEPRQIANVRELVRRRKGRQPLLGVSKIISKDNLGDIDRVSEIAIDLGVDFIFFQQLYADGDPAHEAKQILDTDTDILEGFKAAKRKYERKAKIDITLPVSVITSQRSSYKCYSLYKGILIEPNGALQPCCFIHPLLQNTYGNVLEDADAYVTNAKLLGLRRGLAAGKVPGPCKRCYVLNSV